ncbi:MAG: molecular chaperone HtpG [Cytophagales bacterium]|nr:MAG: molecular chaperone HtpG [Cytophagales bacterium]
MEEKGTLSIHTENIFPIIKKFLYSDHEIFLRELVSNAQDATQKLKKLSLMGEFKGELGDLKLKVKIDEVAKTLTISDAGIGLTADEMKKYINQIAFSGATEFVEKFKDKIENPQDLIGKFGLGFYSAFMVAERVEILSLSYKDGAEAALWSCTGTTDYAITPATKSERGTDIVLYINEESAEFLEKSRISSILTKYCKFLPIEIEFDEKIINNPHPIWTKQPADLKDEDYVNFYKELYPFSEDPLFWIHLNVDYPFNLTGVLYFPKVKQEFELQKNKIQLYSRQVFITDEVKDVVPEFLMLMHGVIDSPDIPLNVSRSYLQADGNVKKINSHITKKVGDKLAELFKNDRPSYESKWDSLGLFVKYGMITDDKFFEKAKDFCLFKNIDNQYFTIDEYREKVQVVQEDKNNNIVYLYTNDEGKQDSYIQSAKKKSYDVLKFETPIDNHFVSHIERKLDKTSFKRIDSDIADKIIEKDVILESILSDSQKEELKTLFDKVINNKNYAVQIEALSADEMPVAVTLPEFMRRMKEMNMGGGGMNFMGAMPDSYTVAVNANHAIMQKILAANEDSKELIAKYAFDLGLLNQNLLTGAALTNFINKSVNLVS